MHRIRNVTAMTVLFGGMLLAEPAPAAAAELSMCNKTDEPIWYVLAGFASETDRLTWRSKGWYKAEAHTCDDIQLPQFLDRHLFLYGYHSNGASWTGDFLFCIDPKERFSLDDAGTCHDKDEGYETRRFLHKTSTSGRFYINLVKN